jgi:SAM-dependent methyltransferase
LARARAGARGGTNAEGGDPASHASPTLLTRHLGHYLAAAEVAGKGVDRLVDVGCGTGAYTGWLGERTGAAITVVDHDPAVLAVAAEVSGATTTALDLAQVEPATLVTAMEVLEHIAPGDQPGFCAALLGTVAPGGHLVLSTPDESLYPGGWSGYAPHIGCVTAGELAAMLVEAGAATVTVFRIVGGPYVTPASRRWVEAIGNRVWTRVRRVAPTLAERLAAAGSHEDEGAVEVDPIAAGVPHVRVVPAEHGRGGSLVAVATV